MPRAVLGGITRYVSTDPAKMYRVAAAAVAVAISTGVLTGISTAAQASPTQDVVTVPAVDPAAEAQDFKREIRDRDRADRSARRTAQEAAEAAAKKAAEAAEKARRDAEEARQAQLVAAPTKAVYTAPKPPPPVFANVGGVVGFAYSQLGKPYVFGAAGPNSYDCSGLVVAAFKAIGYGTLPHTTDRLIYLGIAVSRSQLQPGDLVFPSSGHVGIYIGGNQIIHAPEPGQSVKISTIWEFYAARRL